MSGGVVGGEGMSIDEWGGGRGRGHEHTIWGRGIGGYENVGS